MPHYRFVLLDADGTLFDFDRAEDEALTITLHAHGLPCDDHAKATYRRLNQALWDQLELGQITKADLLATRFGIFLDELGLGGDSVALNAEYLERLGQGAFLLPGAEALCHRLAQQVKLYIVTNGVTTVQHSRLALSPIRDCFAGMFVSEEVGYAKPQQGYFDYVFAHIPDFDPASALIVGDSLTSDITGGNVAGIDNCWYNPRQLDNPRGIAVTYEITRLDELGDIVLGH